ncbi:hypothetical protein HYV50_05880 [Candidatus Pacearchaeota archaeon]|nr:hypothetical protein [Candidatus Pacearchaeota archaeon]
MLCTCDRRINTQPNRELPCNSCSVSDPVYVTGVINIVRYCEGKEIILCEDYERAGVRYDIDENSCKYKISFLEI